MSRAVADAALRPPECLRAYFKRWQKVSAQDVADSVDLVDVQRPGHPGLCKISQNVLCPNVPGTPCSRGSPQGEAFAARQLGKEILAFEVDQFPGLYLFPSLLTSDVQVTLLEKILHRDLSNPVHKTNLHFHHDLPYDSLNIDQASGRVSSFFSIDSKLELRPRDPATHKPLSVEQMLRRKLRWITLGGQYDWTRKAYPDEIPPPFPKDVSTLLTAYFPEVEPQAAIVNFYAPGDTLSIHRDVSEACDKALISISIGCDGLFMIANEDGKTTATIRLRSGDVILMTGSSRFAWHGVPQVLAGTCPTVIANWPGNEGDSSMTPWAGWLATKRINLNVRQMVEI